MSVTCRRICLKPLFGHKGKIPRNLRIRCYRNNLKEDLWIIYR